MSEYTSLEDWSLRYHEDPLGVLRELADRGDWAAFRLGRRRAFLFVAPDYVRSVLNNKAVTHSRYARVAARFVGNGLLTSEGEFHKRQRKLIQPAFYGQQIERYTSDLSRCVDEMLARWQPDEVFDMAAEMSHVSIAMMTRVLFGKDIPGLADGLLELARAASRVAVGRSLAADSGWQAGPQGRVNQTFDDIIDLFIASWQPTDHADRRLISLLMTAHDQEGGMSAQQLRDEVKSLLMTGNRTTAATLIWSLFLLAQHPQEEQVLADALSTNAELDFDELLELDALNCIIKETMRLYPPAWVMTREPAEDMYILDVPVQKGDILFVSPYATHHCERYFENAESFLPSRFQGGIEPHAYFPFGMGPHVCIGKPFALAQLSLTLSAIYRNVQLTLEPGANLVAEPLGMLDPIGALPMRIRQRQPVEAV